MPLTPSSMSPKWLRQYSAAAAEGAMLLHCAASSSTLLVYALNTTSHSLLILTNLISKILELVVTQ